MPSPDHIVYGGTFDPPHQGHIECVETARDRYPEAKISIIPSPSPAGAGGNHKSDLLDFETRWKMTSLAFGPLLSEKIRLNDIEKNLSAPNYTIHTLQSLQKADQKSKFSLLIGDDQFSSFSKWHKAREILGIADLIVIKRGDKDRLSSFTWEEFGTSLDTKIEFDNVHDLKKGPTTAIATDLEAKITILDVNICSASSSLLRSTYATGKPVPHGWVPETLHRWILDHSLYHSEGLNL